MDADYTVDIETRRATFGYLMIIVQLAGTPDYKKCVVNSTA